MKISDITQRSQVQHIAEGRKQLDEIGPAVWAALGVAGAGVTAYDTWQNYQAYKRGDIDKTELKARVGADIALGLIGGGALAVTKALGKGAFRTAKKLIGFGDDSAAAAAEVAKATKIKARADKLGKTTKPDLPDSSGKGSTLLGKGKRIYKTNKAKRAADKGVKTANKKLDKTKIMPTKKGLAKDFGKGAVVGLAVPDSLDPLQDPAYKALGGANKDGAPDAGTGMDATPKKPKKLPRDFLGPGIVGQSNYDKYEKIKKDKGLK